MIVAVLAGAGAVFALMTGVWVLSYIREDASLVDRVWGPAFIVLTAVYAIVGDGAVPRSTLMLVLVTLWGLRLGVYITWRNWGEGEDARYQRMRRRSDGDFRLRSLPRVFWLQAALVVAIGLPQLAVTTDPDPAGLIWLDLLGTALWGVGVYFETVGDYQLARFLADPRNRGTVMNQGLWRYTRHPNYFGDVCVWWGYFLIALAAGAWWSALGPALMTVLIVRVSGVALTEKSMASSEDRRQGYDEYVRRTNAFFPGPPKEPSGQRSTEAP